MKTSLEDAKKHQDIVVSKYDRLFGKADKLKVLAKELEIARLEWQVCSEA